MEKYLEIGKVINVNVYGEKYDGVIVDMDDETITLEESCGANKLIKILFIKNIAAISIRLPK